VQRDVICEPGIKMALPCSWPIYKHIITGRPAVRVTRNHVITLLTAVLVCSLGCSSGEEPQLRLPDGTPIVLVCVDTLRSDRLPAYGYNDIETPAIDRLRHDGILFERAYTNVPLTLPAHVSLLTGLLPPTHGVRDNLGYTVDAATPLLQQSLKEAGYATGAAVSAFVLRHATGVATGFDFYQDDVGFTSGAGLQAIQRPGRETLEAVRPWLRSVAEGPFFLFLHIFEPHSPYEPPEPFASRYSSPYDGEVAAADAVVGDLLGELEQLGVYETALILFLSDHGEGLGDHGEDEHGLFLYRSTLQVPLIMKLPQSQRAGETIGYPVQLVDVYPTITAALGLALEDRLVGAPLLAASRRQPSDSPVYAETFFPRLHFGWSDLAALIDGTYHFIDAPEVELYDLDQDPDELSNLAGTRPELVAELEQELQSYDRELVAPAATDPETRRRLEALGYVGGASTAAAEDLPDPKTRVGALAEIRNAYRLYREGDNESAVEAFKKIVGENPGIEDAWDYLALAQLALGRVDDTFRTYQDAVEQLPGSSRLASSYAMLLYRLGRLEEASVQARNGIPYDATAAHLLLAQIALRRGDLKDAEVEARAALSIGDRRPGPWLVLADVALASGNPQEAINILSKARSEGITDESVRAKLAMTHLWIGELDMAEEVLRGAEETEDLNMLLAFGRLAEARQSRSEARAWFERAQAVDPTNPNVKLHMGIAVLTEGNLGKARQLLEEAVAGIPDSFAGWNALGMVVAQQGDPSGAISAWQRAQEINPEFVDLYFNLGLAYAQAGRLSQALESLESYLSRAGQGPRRDQALAMVQQLRARVPRDQ
jgi:arylsulfatase A-like enzyme/Flp pilus assembly protein TadD